MSLEWYAVYTSCRHEQKVYERLVKKSIYAFLPRMEVWSRRKDQRKKIKIPLFPGYLFVNVDLEPYVWLEILKTPGVAYILGNNKPTPIPESQIASIQILLENDVLIRPHPYTKIGQKVRVVNGPLMGCEGILLRNKPNQQRLIISVELLNRAVSAEIHEADAEPI
jgi:transcription antitermination factor NusG